MKAGLEKEKVAGSLGRSVDSIALRVAGARNARDHATLDIERSHRDHVDAILHRAGPVDRQISQHNRPSRRVDRHLLTSVNHDARRFADRQRLGDVEWPEETRRFRDDLSARRDLG